MLNRNCATALLLLVPSLAAAQEGPIAPAVPDREEPVSYVLEIADLLGDRCVGCHSTALAENDLNMEEVAGLLKGGKGGPAIVPGKAEDSLLLQMAAHRKEPFMPPVEEDLDPLTPDELGLLKLWIDQGAKDDTAEVLASMEAEEAIELGTLPEGVHPIYAVDLTADGWNVACGLGNVVRVVDVRSGLEVVALGGHRDLIESVRYSPDGSRLAAGSYKIATVWNAPKGEELKTLNGHGGPVRAVAATSDGSTVVSGGDDRTLRVWNPGEGNQLRQVDMPNGSQVLAVALSADGKVAATGGSDAVARLWKLEDGALIGEWKGHGGPIRGVALVGLGGSHLATASDDGKARLWPLEGGPTAPPAEGLEPVVLNGHEGPVLAISALPDGSAVITGGQDGTVRLWSVADGSQQRTFDGHSGPVRSLAVSPDGQTLLTGSDDGTARLWTIADGAAVATLAGHDDGVRSVAFSPDGERIATAGTKGLKVWEARSAVGVVAFGHVDANNPQQVAPVHAVAFVDGGRIASASEDRTVRIWGFSGRWSRHLTLEPHEFRVLAIDFSPDGTKVATGGGMPSSTGEVKLWDSASGSLLKELPELHSDTVFGLRFSPDGSKLATAAADRFMKVIDANSGELLKTFEGHTHHVMSVDWKSDGAQLVSGGADHVLKFWEYETGEQVRTSQEVGDQVTAVRWAPGKSEVYGASGDRTVRQWNADNGRIQRTYGGPDDYVYGVDCSDDDRFVAAGTEAGTLYVWRADNAQVIRTIAPPPAGRPEPVELAGEE